MQITYNGGVESIKEKGYGVLGVQFLRILFFVRSDKYFLPIWSTKELNKQLILNVYWLDDNSELMII